MEPACIHGGSAVSWTFSTSTCASQWGKPVWSHTADAGHARRSCNAVFCYDLRPRIRHEQVDAESAQDKTRAVIRRLLYPKPKVLQAFVLCISTITMLTKFTASACVLECMHEQAQMLI